MFDCQVGVEVGLGRFWGFVAEPQCDCGGVEASGEHSHGAGVPHHMWGDIAAHECAACRSCCLGVNFDALGDSVGAHLGAPATAGEHGRLRVGRVFGEPES